MIEYASGSILDSDAEALVCPVNAVGVMGAGLAYDFFRAHPHACSAYRQRCHEKKMKPGDVIVTPYGAKYFVFLATKNHWRNKSKIEWIASGLDALVAEIKVRGIRSIAIPALGCGLGGLQWRDVLPLIERAACQIPDVRVIVFPPKET